MYRHKPLSLYSQLQLLLYTSPFHQAKRVTNSFKLVKRSLRAFASLTWRIAIATRY